MQVLLVNPPIYDFTAYDFWLRPYGMLRVAGKIQHACDLTYFNYLVCEQRDSWGRGRFPEQLIPKPAAYADLARHFRRFGRPRQDFRALLREKHFDVALIQTVMTYWYPGVKEVIEDLREIAPQTKIVLGGVYATLCAGHAESLGPDLVIQGNNLAPLWQLIPDPRSALPYYDEGTGEVAIMKLTEGCPFFCTYCSVPLIYEKFAVRPAGECLEEARRLAHSGVRHVVFYDDALLFKPEEVLVPFLEAIIREQLPLSFHTPNALHMRLLTPDIARLMVRAGFRSFFLGFESEATGWLTMTDGKTSADKFAPAVTSLRRAGAEFIGCYIIIGHPDGAEQEVEASMRYAHRLGVHITLSEFAPVPGTIDGERCRAWTDLDEPLSHNKTAFTIRRLGADRVNQLKALCRELNAARQAGEHHDFP